jgi:hypothetical protein
MKQLIYGKDIINGSYIQFIWLFINIFLLNIINAILK